MKTSNKITVALAGSMLIGGASFALAADRPYNVPYNTPYNAPYNRYYQGNRTTINLDDKRWEHHQELRDVASDLMHARDKLLSSKDLTGHKAAAAQSIDRALAELDAEVHQ